MAVSDVLNLPGVRENTFGEKESRGELEILAGRPHGNRYGLTGRFTVRCSQPDFKRFLDGEQVLNGSGRFSLDPLNRYRQDASAHCAFMVAQLEPCLAECDTIVKGDGISMDQIAQDTGFATWSTGSISQSVQCSSAVLSEIRSTARDGFLALPHGGMEIGGVLFGKRNDASVTVLAQRPLVIEHAKGPGFVLSAKDELALNALVQQVDSGWVAVGWYVSHTRTDLALSDRDVAIYDRHFPSAGQIAIVLKPSKLDSCDTACFLRAIDGSIVHEDQFREVHTPTRAERPVRAVYAVAAQQAAAASNPVEIIQPAAKVAVPALAVPAFCQPSSPSRGIITPNRVVAALGALTLLGAAGWGISLLNRESPIPTSPVPAPTSQASPAPPPPQPIAAPAPEPVQPAKQTKGKRRGRRARHARVKAEP